MASLTTYYADSVSGNDTTGDGSSGNPYQTIAKALTTIASDMHSNYIGYRVIIRNDHTVPYSGWSPPYYSSTFQPLILEGDTGGEVCTLASSYMWNSYSSGLTYNNFTLSTAYLNVSNLYYNDFAAVNMTFEYTGSSIGYLYSQSQVGTMFKGCTFKGAAPYIADGNVFTDCIFEVGSSNSQIAVTSYNADGFTFDRCKFKEDSTFFAGSGRSGLLNHCSFKVGSAATYAIDQGSNSNLIIRGCVFDGGSSTYAIQSNDYNNFPVILSHEDNYIGNGGIAFYNTTLPTQLNGNTATSIGDAAFSDADLSPSTALQALTTERELTPGAVQASSGGGGGLVTARGMNGGMR